MVFKTDLTKVGLTDKEAAVYQAALEMGPSTVQQIARKSRVARATTYLVLEDLLEKGLVTRFVEGKKTMFVAEQPRQLERLIDEQEKKLKQNRENLKDVLPELMAVMRAVDDRPTVRYYPGVEGLRAMRSEMIRYKDPWYNFTHADWLRDVFRGDDYNYITPRRARGIAAKTIFTTLSEEVKEEVLRQTKKDKTERKFISPERYKSSSVMTISGNRVSIGTMHGKRGGVLIESDSVAQLFRDWFELLWDYLD